MSAAGTPSTDPWVILARERARYEEQFRSLKPNNGVVTGDQAKGFFLQSQLPPLVLGQIWALADTDADGKMDINEFSIACKLINLKLRGFEIPKGLPPSLLASLPVNATPPAIPPLPNPALVNAPPRPEPPKVAPVITQQPPITKMQPSQPLISQVPSNATPLVPNLSGNIPPHMGVVPPSSTILPSVGIPPVVTTIPTGIVPPMPSQNLIGGIPTMSTGVPPIQQQQLPPPPPQSNGFVAPLMATQPIQQLPSAVAPISSNVAHMSPVGVAPVVSAAAPGATSTPRASVSSLDRTTSIESLQSEWGVPHAVKLKYTQIFNTTDRTRTGYLSGAQARNVMVQTKLPQNILAQIWALSDMDGDGRLGCEEFVLAMHLCEQASIGNPPPTKLPLDLIPPTFRRTTRTASVSSQGSGIQLDQDPASTLLQTSFEDKRKQNFEKGQAELERRRKALLDQQRKEAEERERKEREEQERKEKARQEAEKKRLEELEKQMREQQEIERLKEEERKRQAEQREAARREMERQRQLEWEKQRLQELQQQRQREQENVLKLKAKNQTLTIELTSLNDQVKELSQKICDTRVGVSNVKSTIDGMRTTRDTQMQEMSKLKNKLKEQNARLLHLSQEKVKLDAKNKLNTQISGGGGQDAEQARIAFENKEITIKNLKEKIEDMQQQIDGKLSDIENNNTQLAELRTQLTTMVSECEQLYNVYEEKRNKVLEIKSSNRNIDYNTTWKPDDAWGNDGTTTAPVTDSKWPVDNWATSTTATNEEITPPIAGVIRYRALYEFVARNNDEISFQPGDIINVPKEQTGEPGWLAGEIRGHTGWFPESYVEPVDGVGVRDAPSPTTTTTETNTIPYPDESKRLEEIAEVPEITEQPTTVPEPASSVVQEIPSDGDLEYYIANYPYQSQEQGDLTFNAGEVIAVVKKEGDWWTGKIGDVIGIFPSNYVQKVDVNTSNTNNNASVTAAVAVAAPAAATPPAATSIAISAAAVTSALENVQNSQVDDNEVSQITENKISDKPPDAAQQANALILKGKKPEIASVIAPYQATSAEQLSLARGQLIMIRKKTDSGWWEGELQAKGRKRQVGWFPASYVKVLNSSGRASGRTTPVSTTRMQQEIVIDKVIALFPYTAGNPDELSFAKDDIISVTAREEEAWWRGELNGVSGLFPSNYVTPLQQQYEHKKRQDSINELIQTEHAYIEDMKIVHKVFEIPLRKSKILPINQIDEIFINWQDIIECNQRFLQDLMESYNANSDTVGDVICQHLPRMTAYITFCGKQLDSANLLQKLTEESTAFKDFVKKCQNHVATKGMPLSSFLIKPMQRITKYPLLISKIMENTPVDHLDYKYLEEAQRVAEKFLNGINENVRTKENQDRLEWVQQCVQNDLNITFNSNTNKLGPRKLLHYGILTKFKSGKELIGFLFNDFFFLVQCSKSLGSQFHFHRNSNVTYKMYKQPILIQDLIISRESTDSVEHGTDSNRVLKLQDNKTKYKILLLAITVHDCSLWTKRIHTAKETYTKVTSLVQRKRKTQAISGTTCGRLLVHVQKGKRFISLGKTHCDNIYCKVILGNQEQQTDIAKDNLINGNVPQNGVPQVPTLVWNYSMQFQITNLHTETITFIVQEMNPFTPDEFLGRAELKLIDIYRETQTTNGPITKKLILHQVESGEIVVKLDLQIFNNY